jgi:hypothetical protein
MVAQSGIAGYSPRRREEHEGHEVTGWELRDGKAEDVRIDQARP